MYEGRRVIGLVPVLDEEQKIGSSPNRVVVNDYDLAGNLVLSIDQRGSSSYFAYDPANRQQDMVDPALLRTYYYYDSVGNRV